MYWNDRKPLLGLFNENPLNQIFICIKMSLTLNDESNSKLNCGNGNEKDNNNNKLLLKCLLQILVEMGIQLSDLWNCLDFDKPSQLNIYLSAIYEFTINKSKTLSYEAIQLWNKLISNEYIKSDSSLKQNMNNLALNLTNTFLLYKIDKKINLTNYDEFDNDDEMHKFFQKYRNELSKLLKYAISIYPNIYIDIAYKWTLKQINDSLNDHLTCYDPSSYIYLTWDALLYLWTNIMQIINRQISSKKYQNNDLEMQIRDQLINLLNVIN